ncbi:hypothetical protein F5B17DRAFT_109069 [Nemania serpens]|nr:hypothetical protein F5B17DRAFT_109069 [Nemania serpens]
MIPPPLVSCLLSLVSGLCQLVLFCGFARGQVYYCGLIYYLGLSLGCLTSFGAPEISQAYIVRGD